MSDQSPPNPSAVNTVNDSMTSQGTTSSFGSELETDTLIQSHTSMDTMLNPEFQRGQLEDVPGLLEYLFPDERLPLPLETLSTQLLSQSKYACWNTKQKTWKELPVLDWYSSYAKAEQKLAQFLNRIGTTLRQVCSEFKVEDKIPPQPRVWEGERTSTPLSADATSGFRKPDLTLGSEPIDSWSSVLLGAEVQCQGENYKDSVDRLNKAARMIFSTQDERRFNIGISFTGYDVRVHVFDRVGIIGSEAFNFCQNPTLFIRLLAGLTLAQPSAIGFDSSIIHDNDRRFVVVGGKKYELMERLFISDTARGRGTVCWRARLDGFDYVVKDAWTDVSHSSTEAVIMRDVAGVEGVAQLVADEAVLNEAGKEDSTSHLREIIDKETHVRKEWLGQMEVRFHRRIVTTPFGHELPHFSTQKELISALIDAINAHRRLVEKGILHRDISLGNIIMYHPVSRSDSPRPSSSTSSSFTSPKIPSLRKGILIDMDYATYMNKIDEDADAGSIRLKTGTLPFMAIDLLLTDNQKHEPRHDLESFFYVFMWICFSYAGPNNALRQNFNLWETVAQYWMTGECYRGISVQKAGFFRVKDTFEYFAMNMIAPYFNNLKPCIRQLRDIVYEKATQHEDIIKILKATMDELPDVETWSAKDDEEGYGLRKSLKRTRDAPGYHFDEETDDEDVFSLPPPKKRPRTEQTRPVPRSSIRYRMKRRICSINLEHEPLLSKWDSYYDGFRRFADLFTIYLHPEV